MGDTEFSTCWCGDPSVFRDKVTLRDYCLECSLDPKKSSQNVYFQFLDITLPFVVGDTVDCFQAGDKDRYVGNGIIQEISTDLKEGGTPAFPVYRVKFDKGRDRWFTAICLRRTH